MRQYKVEHAKYKVVYLSENNKKKLEMLSKHLNKSQIELLAQAAELLYNKYSQAFEHEMINK